MKNLFLAIFVGLICLSSCDEENNPFLSTEEVVQGLKTALQVGTDTTVTQVSKVGGYFKDEAIKILLPQEAQAAVDLINKNNVVKNIANGLGFDQIVSNTIVALNGAAEKAAEKAGPIFKESITSLSITDGWAILNGTNPAGTAKSVAADFDSIAATNYLMSTTYNQLVQAYGTPVNDALASTGTTEIWATFTGAVNQIASYPGVSLLLDIKPINTNLGEYVTEKALDGLFHKVGEVEKDIRKDPITWAKDTGKNILSKVFGTIGL